MAKEHIKTGWRYIQMALPETVLYQLKQIAGKRLCPVSVIVKEAIVEYLSKKGA